MAEAVGWRQLWDVRGCGMAEAVGWWRLEDGRGWRMAAGSTSEPQKNF